MQRIHGRFGASVTSFELAAHFPHLAGMQGGQVVWKLWFHFRIILAEFVHLQPEPQPEHTIVTWCISVTSFNHVSISSNHNHIIICHTSISYYDICMDHDRSRTLNSNHDWPITNPNHHTATAFVGQKHHGKHAHMRSYEFNLAPHILDSYNSFGWSCTPFRSYTLGCPPMKISFKSWNSMKDLIDDINVDNDTSNVVTALVSLI